MDLNAPEQHEFVVDADGPAGTVGVFEDDGETGYLYLYEPEGRGILRHVHVYDRSELLSVSPDDVKVLWSEDQSKCGVVVFGRMRAIINQETGEEGRVWMVTPQTPGIGDTLWLSGFRLNED